jgi:acid phosphatase type 7
MFKIISLIFFIFIALTAYFLLSGKNIVQDLKLPASTPPSTTTEQVQGLETTSDPNFQPKPPYYATFYYPWSKNISIDGRWSYWQDGGHTPPKNWFSNYLPDPNPSAFDPAHELYSSFDDSTILWQLSKLKEAKQEVVISSWWGQLHKTDLAFKHIMTDIMPRADNPYPNIRWTLYYEKEAANNPSVSEIVTDLNYIKQNYTDLNSYLKIDGKPVIFVYAGSGDSTDMTYRWAQAKSQVATPFYIVLKVFTDFKNAPNQPDNWHQYAPANRFSDRPPYYSYVSPGFWKDGQSVRLPRDLGAFETAVKSMVASSSTWKLTQTWNEWGEGTSVEPGEQVIQTTTGDAIVDPSGQPFKNAYIDILQRHLPTLESIAISQATSPLPTTTPSPAPSPTSTSLPNSNIPTIVAAGDIACTKVGTSGICRHVDVANLITSISPQAVLTLGDTQYESATYEEIMNHYDKSWGKFKSITRPSVGNHEYLTPGASGYFDYFNGIGNQTGPAGDRSKGYYSFNIGSWHLIAINANCSQAGGCGSSSPQIAWLKADLALHPTSCTLAYWHQPRFSSGEHGEHTSVRTIWQTLYDANVDIVLNGHDHNYERFAPQNPYGVRDDQKGIRQFIAGTGGKNLYPMGPQGRVANSEVFNNTSFGVLKLKLHSGSYEWQFVPIAGQSFTDTGTGQCH